MNNFRKLLSISLVTSSLSVSCKSDELTPIQVLAEKLADMSIQKTKGNFSNGDGETASGQASIYKNDDNYQLVFENLEVNNEPNFHASLSQEINSSNFVDLKSIKSNQVYNFPSDVDAPSYKYSLVYCEQYSHLL